MKRKKLGGDANGRKNGRNAGRRPGCLVEGKKYATLRDILVTMNAVDVAGIFEEMPEEKLPLLFRLLPKELAADVFAFLEPDVQEHIINSITDAELAKIIEDLFVDDAVDMLEELPATVVKRVMRTAGPETRSLINQFLEIPGKQCWKYYDGRV